jgi:hypothetical protein
VEKQYKKLKIKFPLFYHFYDTKKLKNLFHEKTIFFCSSFPIKAEKAINFNKKYYGGIVGKLRSKEIGGIFIVSELNRIIFGRSSFLCSTENVE